MSIKPLEYWSISEDRKTATRSISGGETFIALVNETYAVVASCVVKDVPTAGLKERLTQAWLHLRFLSPAYATQLSLDSNTVQYRVPTTEQAEEWAARTVFVTHGLAAMEQHHKTLTEPVAPLDGDVPVVVKVNTREGELDLTIYGPHWSMDSRTAAASLNQLAVWLKHGIPDTPLTWGQELERLPLEIGLRILGERINDPVTEQEKSWLEAHPAMPALNPATLISGPRQVSTQEAVDLFYEYLTVEQTTAFADLAKQHSLTVTSLLGGLLACAQTKTCIDFAGDRFDFAGDASDQSKSVALSTAIDRAQFVTDGLPIATVCNAILVYTVLPVVDLAPIFEALEAGQVPTGIFPIARIFKETYQHQIGSESKLVRTTELQAATLAGKVRGGLQAGIPLAHMMLGGPQLVGNTNTGVVENVLRRAGQDICEIDKFFATTHHRTPLLVLGTSTIRGSMNVSLWSQRGAYADGFVKALFDRMMRYIHLVIKS